MRFLLHAKKPQSVGAVKNALKKNAPSIAVSSNESENSNAQSAWGQQCSPNCGCVVRLECNIQDEKIANPTFHTKTVVSTMVQGKREPVLTTRTKRPLLKECKCKTLHHLSNEIIDFINNKPLSTVYNMIQFEGVRSSPAFRQTVLATHKLPREDTHCFDLVEEALTAMVRGYMPQPRRIAQNAVVEKRRREAPPQQEIAQTAAIASTGIGYGVDRNFMSMASARALSALYLLDVDPETNRSFTSVEKPQEHYHEQDSSSDSRAEEIDWVSYVDEMQSEQSS